jgi:hypothetical protein
MMKDQQSQLDSKEREAKILQNSGQRLQGEC